MIPYTATLLYYLFGRSLFSHERRGTLYINLDSIVLAQYLHSTIFINLRLFLLKNVFHVYICGHTTVLKSYFMSLYFGCDIYILYLYYHFCVVRIFSDLLKM